VQRVICDPHPGLPPAIRAVVQGVCWQRGRVHGLRTGLGPVPQSARSPRPWCARWTSNRMRLRHGPHSPPSWPRCGSNIRRGPGAAGRRGGPPGVPAVPARPRAADRVPEPARALEPRDRLAKGRGGHLPPSGSTAPVRWRPRAGTFRPESRAALLRGGLTANRPGAARAASAQRPGAIPHGAGRRAGEAPGAADRRDHARRLGAQPTAPAGEEGGGGRGPRQASRMRRDNRDGKELRRRRAPSRREPSPR
jgi:hypothetical protein